MQSERIRTCDAINHISAHVNFTLLFYFFSLFSRSVERNDFYFHALLRDYDKFRQCRRHRCLFRLHLVFFKKKNTPPQSGPEVECHEKIHSMSNFPFHALPTRSATVPVCVLRLTFLIEFIGTLCVQVHRKAHTYCPVTNGKNSNFLIGDCNLVRS